MTEFEMASLINEMRNGLAASLSLFLGELTAFLVASYLAAHNLTRSMTTIAVGLFLLFSLVNLVSINGQLMNYAGLAKEMKAFVLAGKGLAWHQAAVGDEGAIALAIYVFTAMIAVTIFAAIYFFFHCRRANRQAAASAAPVAPAA